MVCSRRSAGETVGLHLLDIDADGTVARHPLTETRGLDETSPVVSRDGSFVVFVREDHLLRIEPRGRAHAPPHRRVPKVTGTALPSLGPAGLPLERGEAARHRRLDADGKNRETLWQGPIYYRTITPSPDGRFFAATFTYDLGFHPSDALKLRKTEEVRLLDAQGRPLAILARSGRYPNHSPDWGR